MSSEPTIVIVGASARAAAFSALRAGLRPWCVDLFGDEDLRAVAPVTTVSVDEYPERIGPLIPQAPPGAWIYLGGLENRQDLVDRWCVGRDLWGIGGTELSDVRDPIVLFDELEHNNIPCPNVRGRSPTTGLWLCKPMKGTGGRDIRFWKPGDPQHVVQTHYLQEYLDGVPLSAIFVGTPVGARLLGVTRQLIGEPWLHAPPFGYCGSIGPLPVSPADALAWNRIGHYLADEFNVFGLFGVDAIHHDGLPYPVEVNPRYTASVEVLEYATGLKALAWHWLVFDPETSPASASPAPVPADGVVGKAVLFAARTFRFPADGPWTETLRRPFDPFALPAFADIPAAGREIQAGRPVLSFFARADTPETCLARLRATAAELDARLWQGSDHAIAE